MKLITQTLIFFLTLLTFGCNQETNTNQSAVPSQLPLTSKANIIEYGNFVKAEVPTEGKMRIVSEGGKQYLEFEQDFKTKSGPDLYVILHRSNQPLISGLKEQDYVTISKLEKISGSQRYFIAANVNLKNFRSVAVWCRKFNATFGYAAFAD
ncbi:MAG TPA: DM13 domain-containing protein [Candidatus Sericytochromatia bacterium]|jgi:hypothetical protein